MLEEVGSSGKMLLLALGRLFLSRGCVYVTEAGKERDKCVWALATGHTLQAMLCIILPFSHCLVECIGSAV